MRRSALLMLLPALGLTVAHADDSFDHSLYDGLLQAYVNADGLVNYEGLRTSSLQDLQTYLDQLANADLKKRDSKEKMAFWINAYNAHVIHQVLQYPEMKKISEHRELFDIPFTIAKGTCSLNDIENRILRGEMLDSRVHFALVPGAIDSPRLRNFAYTGKNLEATLRENSLEFANSPKYLRIEKDQLRISGLLKEHADDFKVWGGLTSYLNHLVDPARRKDASQIKQLLMNHYDKTEFVFDWTLNDIRHAATQRPKLLRAPK